MKEKKEPPKNYKMEMEESEDSEEEIIEKEDPLLRFENVTDKHNYNELHWAALRGEYKEIKSLLLKEPLYLNDTSNEKKVSPIHWAAIKGDIKSIMYLVESNAELNLKDINGEKKFLFYQIIKAHLSKIFDQIPFNSCN